MRKKHAYLIAAAAIVAIVAGLFILDSAMQKRYEVSGAIASWQELPLVGPSFEDWVVTNARAETERGSRFRVYYVTGHTSEQALRSFAMSRDLMIGDPPDAQLDVLEAAAAAALRLDREALDSLSQSDTLVVVGGVSHARLNVRLNPDTGLFVAHILVTRSP